MIETKEQYEFIARQVFGGRDWKLLNETIEALREVATAASEVAGSYSGSKLSNALAALPDWLKE